ncbi:MAG: hypothetical protein ACRDKJ_09735 [Actinomycetota bacterium]
MLAYRYARRTAAVVLGSLALVVALGSTASAQVPALPELPEAPEEVTGAVNEVQNVVVPIMVDAAIAGQPAAQAVGFALRPGCSGAGTAVIVAALLGSTLPLPVSPGLVMSPAFIMCGAAFAEGPADPLLAQVDGAAGPPVEDAAAPVLDQLSTAIAPVRPNLSEGCTALALFGSAPEELPPPSNRLDVVGAVCG